MTPESKLRLSLLLLALIITVGTAGYSLIEQWTIIESLYMTVITLATVGFSEVRPLSESGRVFTMFLIVFGAFNAGFVVTAIGQMVLEGQLQAILGRRKMERKVQQLKDHVILCGYGRVGRQVAQEFARRRTPFVIIERAEVMIPPDDRDKYIFLTGDAADDDMLMRAGIERARAIVSTLPDDADNVYLALTAHQISPDLQIIVRAETQTAKKKLLRAGASRVVCPHELGGTQMAMATLRPNVVDFFHLASEIPGGAKFGIEEISVGEGGCLAGKTIIDAAIKSKYDAIVVGLRKRSGELIFNPPGSTIMEATDILIVLGESEKLETLSADIG
jgi:voltage-gated potassium channel